VKEILFIANYRANVGGISGQVYFLHNNIDKEKYTSRIFNVKGGLLKRLIFSFKLLFLSRKFDIFHIHACSGWGGIFPFIIGTLVGRLRKKKIIVTYHGGGAYEFFSKYPKTIKFLFKYADEIVVLSPYLQNIFEKFNITTLVIPNIIEFINSQKDKITVIKPNFISTRALEPLYNIKCIIDGFNIVKKKLSSAKLLIVGDGSQREYLENYVKTQNLNDVIFTGRVKNKEINNYLAKADILISAPKVDNMPISLLEAFNSKLLVISSNIGGVPYMIDDQVNGLLYEYNNAKQLAERMIYSICNPENTINMIDTAYKNLSRYNWENNKDKIYALYS